MHTWQVTEDSLEKDRIRLNETLFHTANGYLGVRGNFEEGLDEKIPSTRGTYINGFYESYGYSYPRKNPADPDFGQTVIPVTDAQQINVWFDDEPFSLFAGTLLNYKRTLDMQDGTVTRTIEWQSPNGKKIKLTILRMASFVQKELFIIRYLIDSIDFEGTVRLDSSLENPTQPQTSDAKEDDLRRALAAGFFLNTQQILEEENRGYVLSSTKNSKLSLVCGAAHQLSTRATVKTQIKDNSLHFQYQVLLEKGQQIQFEKYIVYTDSRRYNNPLLENKRLLAQTMDQKWSHYAKAQQDYLKEFWQHSDVLIENDDSNQQAIRFNLYQILQSAGRDYHSNISAKGLAGDGYEGNYFWDTEIYLTPFLIFSCPEIAKNLLLFRYHTLDASRDYAKQMGHPNGARIPWRTIGGSECEPCFIFSAEYHINPDVAYTVMLYYQVTDDLDFLAQYGAELLFETARVMLDLGYFDNNGAFNIFSVTGPDEYAGTVDNNYYTNVMTKFHFQSCVTVWQLLKTQKPKDLEQLIKKININVNEIEQFKRAADQMRLLFDESLQIHPQYDLFLQKKAWDFEHANYPLVLHYSIPMLTRYRVCRQADVVLANMLREEETTLDVMRNDYYYYEKITTHDSSLSFSIFSIMANRIGDVEKAFYYFEKNARLDLDDLQHNSHYGLHTACIGGSWMCLTYGFAGLRIINGNLHLRPLLPKQWKKMQFPLYFKARRLLVSMTHEGTTIQLISGKPLIIYMNDQAIELI